MDLPLHPLIVHAALGLAVAVALLAPLTLFGWARAWLPRGSWWLVVSLQALLLVSAVTAVRSGEEASLDARDFIALERIQTHQDWAERFTIAAAAVLALSLGAALYRDQRRARRMAIAAVIAIAVQLALGIAAGHAGGSMVWGPQGLVDRARHEVPSLRGGADPR